MTTPTFSNSGSKQPAQGGEVACCSIAGGPFAAVDAYVSGGGGAELQMRLYATVGTLRTLVATAPYSGPPVGAAGQGSVLKWTNVLQPDATSPVVAGGTQYDLVAFGLTGAGASIQCTLAGTNAYDAAVGASATVAVPSNYGSTTVATNVGCAQLADVGVDQAGVPSLAFDVFVSCGAGSVEALVGTGSTGGTDGKADVVRQLPLPVGTQYRLAVRETAGARNVGNVTASLGTYNSIAVSGETIGSLPFVDWKVFGVNPTASGAANSINFKKGLDTLAGTGVALWLSPGAGGASFSFATPVDVPNDTIIWGDSTTRLVSTIPYTGSVYDSLLRAKAVFGVTTTLAADALPGTPSLTLTDPTGFAIGKWIYLSKAAGFHGASFEIVNIVGPVITLDRPVQELYPAGSNVDVITVRPANILIYGNGMQVSGTGARWIEFEYAYRCFVDRVYFDVKDGATSEGYATSFDTGGTFSTWSRCRYELDTTGISGPAIEAGESCGIVDTEVNGGTGNGFIIQDCVDCYVDLARAYGCAGLGYLIGSDGNEFGSLNTRVTRSVAVACQYGAEVAQQSSGTSFEQFFTLGNTKSGLVIYYDGSAAPLGTRVDDSAFESNGEHGVWVNGNAKGTVLSNVRSENNTLADVRLQDEAIIQGLYSLASTSTYGVQVTDSARALLSGLRMSSNKNGWYGIVVTSAEAYIEQAAISLGGTGQIGVYSVNAGTAPIVRLSQSNVAGGIACVGAANNGIMSIDHTTLSCPAGGIGVNAAAGSTTRMGDGFDASGSSTPTTFPLGSYANRGTVAGAGGAGTAVAFPDLKATDRVVLTPHTEATFAVSMTPGTGFSAICAAGATFDYCIV